MRLERSIISTVLASIYIGLGLTACGSGEGILGRNFVVDSGLIPFSVLPANAQEAAKERPGTSGGMFSEDALRQRLLVSTRAPKIIAEALSDIPEAQGHAKRVTERKGDLERGQRWTEAAQIGLLFGSPEGKAFLSSPDGRALVRGEPYESCPSLEVAAADTDDAATGGALQSCLQALSLRHDCGCRVIAQGDRLLAPGDEFNYAIGIGTTMVVPSRGMEMTLTSEERPVEGRVDARHIWILGADAQPFALLQVEPDGRAALVIWKGREAFNGTHKEDGFRRGRVLRRAYLTNAKGEQMVVLVGYEDQELEDNRAVLSGWNPDGPLVLKLEAEKEDG